MNLAQWIITTGGVVTALAAMVQFVVRPVVKWATRIEKAVTLVEMNMFNNGGASLRDAIDRIESRLENLEKKSQSSTVRKKSTTK
jgi:ubiquinone biosynthesis protein UbiJ